MKLLVIGTPRGRPDVEYYLDRWATTHGLPTQLIAGCGQGVETQAHLWALKRGLSQRDGTLVYEVALWRPHGSGSYDPDAGRKRHVRMVARATVGDWLLALPAPPEGQLELRATSDIDHCIARAQAAGLRVFVCPLRKAH